MLIVLNHKMNRTLEEIKEYEFILRDYDVVVMPETPFMGLFTSGKYTLGSQCLSEYNAPGGISASALTTLNVKYVLVGHYERRNINRETDDAISKKITATINNNMMPILCIGNNVNEDIITLKKQIDKSFNNPSIDLSKIIIAYEPISSIGTNQLLDPLKIKEKIILIKEYLKIKYNLDTKVLYGGSINSKNVKSLKDLNVLDGIIVGTASLDIKEVINIYNKIYKSS